MPSFVADYLADTAHLSAAEPGANLLLTMNYWQREKRPHKLKSKGDISDTRQAQRREARHNEAKAPSRAPLPGSRASRWNRSSLANG